ncbi:MAG: transposase [Eubacterium sp.]
MFLSLSKELRDFCGFDKVPDASLLTRFKQDFCPFLEQMFEELVDLTEPICQAINASLSSMLTFDTSGIELYVTENNPKYFNSLLNQIKTTYKDKPKIKPLNIAYSLMPSAAAAATDAKQLYINGHFCYADKFAILTNGLGVVRHISFLDDSDFKEGFKAGPSGFLCLTS